MKKTLLFLLLSFIWVNGLVSAETSTTFTVNQTHDAPDTNPGDGLCDSDPAAGLQCTVRAAIEEANFDLAADTVSIPAGTYAVDDDALEVTAGTLALDATGAAILDGTDSDSGILFVRDGATVTVDGLTFENGSGGCFPVYGCGMGGAITNRGNLTLENCTVRNSKTTANGGGIVNNQTLLVEDCTIENNRAGQVGGGIYTSGYDFANATTVRNSTLRDNLSTGGGGMYIADANVLLFNVTVEHNAAFGGPPNNSYGGGLSIKSSSDPFLVSIQNSTFADNYSEASGGAIFSSNAVIISGSELRHNYASQRGGAIFSQIEPPTVANSLIFGNEAGFEGGAIFQNSADFSLSGTAIFDNVAGRSGGAWFVKGGTASAENSTFSQNTAPSGSALHLADDFSARYVTIAENDGDSAISFDDGTLSLGSSIIAGHATTCAQADGTFTSVGHNVIDSISGCTVTAAGGDQFNTDPQLGMLQDNGGARVTLTHEPSNESPALEAGDPGDCPSFDQRGVSRPVNGECDAGAVEYDSSTTMQPWSPTPALPPFTYAEFPTPVAGTTFVVDSAENAMQSDATPGDGLCETNANECTLRAAIQESNALPGQDTILLPSGVYTISTELDLTDHTIIDGAGADTTTLVRSTNSRAISTEYSTIVTIRDVTMRGASRFLSNYGALTVENCVVADNTDSSIFSFYSYADTMPTDDPYPTVTVRNCEFRDNAGAFNGAAIYADGAVSVYDSVFENNAATNGGAIYSSGGGSSDSDLVVASSRFEGNSAESQGGAIRNRWSRITVENSVFLNNDVTGGSSPQGGAIATSALITITDSYFEGNSADYAGGAIANGGEWNVDVDPAIVTVERSAFVGNSAEFGGGLVFSGVGDLSNTTFSNNSATRDGGGILVAADSTATLNSLTLVDNTADSDNDDEGAGGGIQLATGLWDSPGDFTLQNSILYNNSAFEGADCFAPTGLSLGTNVIGTLSDCAMTTVGSDWIGVDPQLSGLVSTQTHNRVHLPLPGSPLLGAGNGCPAVDQRGVLRNGCDRGSAELAPPTTFTVGATDDAPDLEPGDGICATANGSCTFTAAIQEANAWNYTDTVKLPAGTYVSDNVLIAGGDITIEGAGADQTMLAANTTRSGNNRVLTTGTILNTAQQIILKDLAIEGGNLGTITARSGGGINNVADLTLERVLVQNNQAGIAGGISNGFSGNLTVIESAIVNNTAQWFVGTTPRGYGGGIVSGSSAGVELVNVTVSGNSAEQYGGGIVNVGIGLVSLDQVTVADNHTNNGYGGGIVRSAGGPVTLENTILADNTAATTDPDCYGSLTAVRNRVMVETVSANCTFNTTILNDNPQLGTLGDNGGTTPTHELGRNSPAIDAGGSNCPITDQRGYLRTGDCDLGAYESNAIPTAVSMQAVELQGHNVKRLLLLMLLLGAITIGKQVARSR